MARLVLAAWVLSAGSLAGSVEGAPSASLIQTAKTAVHPPVVASVCDGCLLQVLLRTDGYPSETSWKVVSSSAEEVLTSPGALYQDSDYKSETCLGAGIYTFTIYDTYGDGICCNYGQGWYAVSFQSHGGIWTNTTSPGADPAFSGMDFTNSDSVVFPECVVHPPTPTPPVVSSSGDPHMINIRGDAFDLYRTGVFEFLKMPKNAVSHDVNFKLVANVTNLGGKDNMCSKALYITRLLLDGNWFSSNMLDVRVAQGKMQVVMDGVQQEPSPMTKFIGESPFGPIGFDMKNDDLLTLRVGSARIAIGVDKKHLFLNLQATGLKSWGGQIGGLLGEEDHSWISMRPASCSQNHDHIIEMIQPRVDTFLSTADRGSRVDLF